jgi:hypothetical protein
VQRVKLAIEKWNGTPYMSGQQVPGPGGAVDCIRYACGVLDDLYGYRRVLPRNLPLDTSIHAPESARAAMRKLLRMYPEAEAVLPTKDGQSEVEPADIIATGPSYGGPGHAVLVGWEPNTCWEASSPRVRKVGIGIDPRTMRVFGVYRMRDRERWLSDD